MLEVMGEMTVTWDDLDSVWPWSRVLAAHETVQRKRYHHALPIAHLHSTFISAHLPKGKRAPTPHDLLLPGALPPELREAPAATASKAVYSPGVVRAFTLARSLGFTGNAHLAAFGTNELRASGWGREG